MTVTDGHGAVLAAGLTGEHGRFAFRELPYTDGTVEARVTLVHAVGDVVDDVITAMAGAYAFSDLDAGEYTIIAAGYPPTTVHPTVSSGHDRDGLDLEPAHSQI
ncbi:SdrD B-like domain-containing protein [Streptomyces sp. NPDC047461]|uniref:SdrD B-like domain-containing protein n=1 Tax=Streptomyces sp. NPDC047461 TaxID=3155619 RepID=UPI0033E5A97F